MSPNSITPLIFKVVILNIEVITKHFFCDANSVEKGLFNSAFKSQINNYCVYYRT